MNYGPPVPESKSILVMANINLTSGSSETVNNIHLPSAPHASIAFSRLSHLVFLNCSLQWTHHRAYVTLTNDLINVDEEVLDITNVDYSSICKHCAGRWGSEVCPFDLHVPCCTDTGLVFSGACCSHGQPMLHMLVHAITTGLASCQLVT